LTRLAIGLLFAYAAWGAVLPYKDWFGMPVSVVVAKSQLAVDGDQAQHFYDLSQFPTFASTFYYWTHDWSGGFPYWRPLTCQLFWIEMHVFGAARFDLWSAVSVLSQLLLDGLLAWFVKILTGRWSIGALAAAIFSGNVLPGFLSTLAQPFLPDATFTSTVVDGNWKNQPDIWMSACTIGSVVAAMNRRWAIATVVALTAPCFKENGWLAFPLIALFVGMRGELKLVPKVTWAINAAFISLWIALRKMAHLKIANIDTIGHNLHPMTRYLAIVLGPYFGMLERGHLSNAVVATGLAVTIAIPRVSYRARIAIVLLSAVGGGLAGMADLGQGFAVGLLQAIDPSFGVPYTIGGAIWLAGALILLMDAELRVLGIVLYVLRLISAATVTMALAVGVHTIYLSNAFYCTLYALAIYAIWKRVRTFIRYSHPARKIESGVSPGRLTAV
jgi:hypothetical protein